LNSNGVPNEQHTIFLIKNLIYLSKL